MSGLSMFMNSENIVLATDTMATERYGFPFKVVNHTSKVQYFPHVQCCAITIGCSKLADDLYFYIQRVKACDFNHVIMAMENHFFDSLDMSTYDLDFAAGPDLNLVGRIYLVGASMLENKMVGYDITINKDGLIVREMSLDNSVLLHPPLDKEKSRAIWDRYLERDPSVETIKDIMVSHVEQMNVDSQAEETFSVAVGLEIHPVHLSLIDGKFSVHFFPPKRFANFTEEYLKIFKNVEGLTMV